MNKELEALQNIAKECKLYVAEFYQQDKRIKTKKYFAYGDNGSVSPKLAYNELNHFLLGWLKAKSN